MITILSQDKLRTSDLQRIPVTVPDRAGPRWKPIRHYDLATALQDGLWSRRIGITKEAWAVDPSGQTLIGGFNLRLPDAPHMPGLEYALGIRHSNDQKHALTFAVGATVMVCLNGLITGTWVLKRKHTTGLDLKEAVHEGLDRFTQEVNKVSSCVQEMKSKPISTRQADHYLMEACREKVLPWSHTGHVWNEYRHPRHAEFRGHTAWNLYNAFTEVSKRRNPSTQLDALDSFRRIVLN